MLLSPGCASPPRLEMVLLADPFFTFDIGRVGDVILIKFTILIVIAALMPFLKSPIC